MAYFPSSYSVGVGFIIIRDLQTHACKEEGALAFSDLLSTGHLAKTV